MFLLQLGSAVLLLDSLTDRQLLCECTTTHCKNTNRRTCHSQYKCYTQYLDKKDGSHPITRGCVQGSTPILCENRRPEVRRKLKWPYLRCCDGGDLCNSAVMPTPPSWVGSSSEKGGGTNDTQQQLNTTVSSSSSDASSSLLAFWVRQGNDRWPISKPTVLVILFAGLFLLVSIMAFGFYILKIQSNYLTQLRRGYERATEEESIPVVSSSGPPPYHMTVIAPNPERKNSLKSVQTQ